LEGSHFEISTKNLTSSFQEVRIIDETILPFEFMSNDPNTMVIREHLKIPPEKIKEIAGSVVSIKVFGVKKEV